MEAIKLISFILLFLYFLYKIALGFYVYFKKDLVEINTVLPTIKSKMPYLIGIIENFILMILVFILYIK